MTDEARLTSRPPNYKDRRDLQLAEERSYLERLGDPGEKFRWRSKFGDKLNFINLGR